MGPEIVQLRILKDTLHPALCSGHCPVYIFQILKIFQKTGRKARLQNHCVQRVLHWMNLMHKMHNAHHMHQGHSIQHMRILGSQPSHLVIFICKDTIAPGSVKYQVANVEL